MGLNLIPLFQLIQADHYRGAGKKTLSQCVSLGDGGRAGVKPGKAR